MYPQASHRQGGKNASATDTESVYPFVEAVRQDAQRATSCTTALRRTCVSERASWGASFVCACMWLPKFDFATK